MYIYIYIRPQEVMKINVGIQNMPGSYLLRSGSGFTVLGIRTFGGLRRKP